MRARAAAFAALALLGAAPPSSQPVAAPFVTYTRQFAAFADAARDEPPAARMARFDAEIRPLFPSLYARRTATQAVFEQRIGASIDGFPAIRERYRAIEAAFPAAYATAVIRYGRAFPGFVVDVPVYLLHSLGELDGGTRVLGDRAYLVFGADVMARFHDPARLGPFLDHELFHVENIRHFADCAPLWCALWQEGLATYAAASMNPGASDAALLLDVPVPLRARVDARWREALCETRAALDTTDGAARRAFFTIRAEEGPGLPSRFGYYVGYRLLARIGRERPLATLARLDHAPARRLLDAALGAELAAVGGCASVSG